MRPCEPDAHRHERLYRPGVVALAALLLASCGGADSDGNGTGGSGSSGGGGDGAAAGTGGAGGNVGGSGGGPFVGPCSRHVTGDVAIEDQADADALRDVCTIDGDLSLLRTEIASFDLPELTSVTGLVSIRDNSVLTDVNLPALQVLGREDDRDTGFVALQNESLAIVRLPSGSTAGKIELQLNPALIELDLEELVSTVEVVVSGAALSSLDLPALTSGDLALSYNDELELVNAPLWTSGGLMATDCDALHTLSFPGLVSGQGIELRRNESLTLVSLPALESMSGMLIITHQPVLEELTFPAMTTTQWFEVRLNDALVSVDFPALQTIADDWLEIAANPSLETVSLPSLILGAPSHVSQNPMLMVCDGPALADVADCE